ncbi:MAG: N-acetyltransferase [Defluviitaleaceae bacterium]|nr:N-acetyltransferase [Defluviitaleaceae bacterium]
MTNITFRLETHADRYAVEALTREAFWKFWETDGRVICDEHLLVNKLRTAQGYVPELNFVAEIDGKIVGHIIYSKSKVVDGEKNEHELLTFGPLSVLPKEQKKGIGQALMRHSFAEAKKLGYRGAVIYGHPKYYPRVGFRRAAEFGITTPEGEAHDYFMALPFYLGALDGISGKHYIDAVYWELTQKDALEFDKKFPYKEPHILAAQ